MRTVRKRKLKNIRTHYVEAETKLLLKSDETRKSAPPLHSHDPIALNQTIMLSPTTSTSSLSHDPIASPRSSNLYKSFSGILLILLSFLFFGFFRHSEPTNVYFDDFPVIAPHKSVPKFIHQTHSYEFLQLPEEILSRIKPWQADAGWEYFYYSDEIQIQFIRQHFPERVQRAYNNLRPGAFKTDFFRYCLLYIKGGLYADLDLKRTHAPLSELWNDLNGASFMVGIDRYRILLWNAFLLSSPGNPIIRRAIMRSVTHIEHHYYGCNPLDVTGPGLLTDAVGEFFHWSRRRIWPQGRFTFGDYDIIITNRTYFEPKYFQHARFKTVTHSGPSYGKLWGWASIFKDESMISRLSQFAHIHGLCKLRFISYYISKDAHYSDCCSIANLFDNHRTWSLD